MKFLINRTDAIGDTVLSLPVAQLIKEKFPSAKIAFLVSPISHDIFLSHPYVDEVIVFNKNENFAKKLKSLKTIFNNYGPDHYLYMGGSHLVSAYAKLKNIKFRGGLVSRLASFLFLNHGVRQKRSMVSMHETDYNLHLLAPLGIEYPTAHKNKYAPVIKLGDEEKMRAYDEFNTTLKEEGFDCIKPKIFIHPGMTGHTLNWSSRNYARLIKKLDTKFPDKYQYIISHTPSDEAFLIGFREFFSQSENLNISKKIYYFNGALKGLRNYICVLSKAKLFVGPSTGTLHLAHTLKVACVGIYSPIRVQSSLRWGPFNRKNKEKTRVVVPDVICGEQSKCIEKQCPYYKCMDKIEVEDIIKEMIPLLENK